MNALLPSSGRVLRLGLVLPVLALLVGCGGKGTVSGTVTYKPKGKNVTGGTVMVMSQNGTAHYGPINPDGTYRVEGVPPGSARVTVSSPDPGANATVGRETAPGMPGKPVRGGAAPAAPSSEALAGWFAIPEKYGDANESGLTLDVRKGANTFNIDLD